LLGLGMMAVLEDSLQLIRHRCHEEVDLAHLPADDPAVYAALQKADTVGMFQIESRAQMSCLPRLRPRHFYDIVVQVAIIRPGPIVGKMVNPFLKRRQGREPVAYPHPSLEPVLARTLGVPLFQEQLLRMAMITAGFSGGEAEELRRAMGFKRSEKRMRDIEIKLRAGMTRNGIAADAQQQIIESIVSFALYGFPESHAASFALLAYASAYLKTHHLAAFTAALLNNQPMGFYHPSTVVKDAQRHGLKMRPVDVTCSDWLCTLEEEEVSRFTFQASQPEEHDNLKRETRNVKPDLFMAEAMLHPQQSVAAIGHRPSAIGAFSVRLGLRYVKGLREDAARALVTERTSRPFDSITDLARRVPELRKNELATLAEIGALNRLGQPALSEDDVSSCTFQVSRPDAPDNVKRETRNVKPALHRRDALWQVERAGRPVGPLLQHIPEPDAPSPLAMMNREERLVADFRGTGLTVGPHPMSYQRDSLRRRGIRTAAELEKMPHGQFVKAAGCVIARQRPGTAHGFVFLSLEDETGIANAIVTPDLFDQNRLLLVASRFLLVEGVLQNQDNVVSVKAERVLPLPVSAAETRSHDFH
jgi:error-prone DNA polymerase